MLKTLSSLPNTWIVSLHTIYDGSREDFEPTRAALLSRSPLPSLDAAIKELISEENRRPHHHIASSDVVLATPCPLAFSSN